MLYCPELKAELLILDKDNMITNRTCNVVFKEECVYVENVVLDKSFWNVMIYGDGKDKSIVSANSKIKNHLVTLTVQNPFYNNRVKQNLRSSWQLKALVEKYAKRVKLQTPEHICLNYLDPGPTKSHSYSATQQTPS
ncbi:hypothetical protein LXL04_022744 [Taraxacum kok-saghyz]